MLEERNEGFISTGEMVQQPGEREDGPTSIDVADKEISIGEVPVAVSQEEKLQEQEQVQQELKISKRKQKRRITSYLSNISKQIEKNGNQINKITTMVQSIQKQKQTKSTKGARVSQSPLQLISQVQSQVSQLQKQVARIQNDIQRIRIISGSRTTTRTKFKKLISSSANIKPRSKKSKSLKSTKVRRGRKSR
jgi:chromosome segregation ATPase